MESTRILIADDQADILEALKILLKNQGFTPEAVSSPRAAMEAVQSKEYDILLLDLNYARDTTSGGEGLELLSRIQSYDSALPIVLMTAWGSVQLAVEAMQHGGRDFIQKPWDNDRLLEILRRHVEEGRALRERKKQEKANEWLLREIEEARDIQQRMMPSEMPQIAGCDIQATWQPANDVGGDYFDAIPLGDSRVAFCIADVAGKGLPAALLMSNTQATVRAFARSAASPADLCAQVNRIIAKNMSHGKFITFFYAILDTSKRTLRYCNAGHLPPILIHRDGSVERLGVGGMVLGIMPGANFDESEIPFTAGDRLILFTDGLSEASRTSGEEFGVEGLLSVIQKHRGRPAQELQQAIMQAASEFSTQGLQDDATLMILTSP